MKIQPQDNDQPTVKSKASLLKCFFIVLLLLLLWHFVAPLFGIAVGAAGGAVSVVIASIVILCMAVVLSFVWVGMAMLFVAGITLVWIIMAIALFPFLLPFLLPALLITLIVRLLFGRK